MSKGRKPTPPATDSASPQIDVEQVNAHLRTVDKREMQLAKIDRRFGGIDGEVVPYQRDRIIDELRFFMAQSAQALLETGKRLLLIKEHESHGDWLECLRRAGIEAGVAQRAMKAAVRFGGSNTPTSAYLGKSKMIELMVLDDESIAELDQGGTVAGLTLDKIDKMSVRELRAALRAANEEKAAKDRLLAEKNTRIDELQSRPLASVTWDYTAKLLIEESDALFAIVQENLGRLMAVQQAMMTADFGNDADVDRGLRACAIAFGDKLTRSSQMLSELRGMHDRTLGGFVDALDAQPVDYDQAAAVPVAPLHISGRPDGKTS